MKDLSDVTKELKEFQEKDIDSFKYIHEETGKIIERRTIDEDLLRSLDNMESEIRQLRIAFTWKVFHLLRQKYVL